MSILSSIQPIRNFFVRLSAVDDYYDAYPQLGPQLLKIWSEFDTRGALTDYYKHLRSAEEIKKQLQECGMVDIETTYAGNGVEARARKPITSLLSESVKQREIRVEESVC